MAFGCDGACKPVTAADEGERRKAAVVSRFRVTGEDGRWVSRLTHTHTPPPGNVRVSTLPLCCGGGGGGGALSRHAKTTRESLKARRGAVIFRTSTQTATQRSGFSVAESGARLRPQQAGARTCVQYPCMPMSEMEVSSRVCTTRCSPLDSTSEYRNSTIPHPSSSCSSGNATLTCAQRMSASGHQLNIFIPHPARGFQRELVA